MSEGIHRWLVDHPIWQSIIINTIVGIALLVAGAYWKFIVAFSKIPPQRLGTWLRKARLSWNGAKLAALRRANEEPRYALVLLLNKLLPLFLWLAFLVACFAMIVTKALILPQPSALPGTLVYDLRYLMFETRSVLVFFYFAPTMMIVVSAYRLNMFAAEFANFERTESKLIRTVNDLKAKLGEPLESTPHSKQIDVNLDIAIADEAGQSENKTFHQGARVRHPRYGEGVIFRTEGTGEAEKVTVLFERHGMKKLVSKFAQLERL